MKRRTPRGIWALRAVTVAMALIVILVIGGVVYSAYEDYTAVKPYLGSPQHPAGSAVINGSTAIITFNVTVPNRGIFSLNVTVACVSPPLGVTCQRASVNVPPGQEEVLRFEMTVDNAQQFVSLPDHSINGTVAMGLVPFATLTVDVDFGGLLQSGGG